MRLLIFVLLFAICLPPLLAQNTNTEIPFSCGGNIAQEILWKQFPELKILQQQQDEAVAHTFHERANAPFALRGANLTLPVVVHIVHNGGAENISDAQVQQAINNLNAAFAHSGYYAKAGDGVDAGISFCLAKRDPDGKATTGINRIVSPLTQIDLENDDIKLKDLSRWDPTRYVNVWVVQSINSLSSGPGVAGYAYFPSSHGRPEDGMVCEAQFFGVGPQQDMVFVHEMGHYLNLYHTFEGGCKNDNCLLDGDRVCDTPPDQARHTACPHNSCGTDANAPSPNPFASDVNDMTENFMDYSPFECVYRFTQGQADRMQQAVKTTRASLLSSDGCLEACNPLAKADFDLTPAGGGIAGVIANFQNKSTGATTYEWWIDGTKIAMTANTSYTFNFPGVYSIKLVVTNGDPNCKDSLSSTYVVTCPLKSSFTASKTAIKVGESIDFASTATGSGSLEWFINGVSVGTGPTLKHNFSAEGTYTIVLRITGNSCQDESTVVISVEGDCPELAPQMVYTASNNSMAIFDTEILPNGNMIACGTTGFNTGIVVLYDRKNEVLWTYKSDQQVEAWSDLCLLPDGTIALLGNGKTGNADLYSITIIDVTGKVLQFWKLKFNTGSSYDPFSLRSHLVADPDGSMVLSIPQVDRSLVLAKLRNDGTVLWSKTGIDFYQGDIQKPGGLGIGYLLSRSITPNSAIGAVFEVFTLNTNGDIVSSRAYRPSVYTNWMANNSPQLLPHPDGGYAIVSLSNTTPFKTHFMRCAPNGNILWANHYLTSGANPLNRSIQYFQNKGWCLLERGTASVGPPISKNTLLRISETGSLLWQKHFKDAVPAPGMWFSRIMEQGGTLRFVNNEIGGNMVMLGQVSDAHGVLDCMTQAAETQVLSQQAYTIATASATQMPALPLAVELGTQLLTDFSMNKTTFCAAPPPCPEICDNGKDDDKDGYIDCYDTDCQCFSDGDCIAQNLDPNATIEGKVLWRSYDGGGCVNSTPIVANLNPQTDTIPEIIIVRSKGAPSSVLNIFKGDGSNANNPDDLTVPGGFAWNGQYPVVGDINKDGIPELIIVDNNSTVRVFRNYVPNANPPMTLWCSSDLPTSSLKTRAMLADFDQDGQPEVYAGNDVFKFDFSNPTAPKLTRVLNGLADFGLASTLGPNLAMAADLLGPADCNGDPDCNGLEIAAGSVIYSIDLDLFDGDGYEIKAAKNLNTLQSIFTYKDGYTTVADMDLDGTPDVIVNSGRNNTGGVYVWNKNGLIRFMSFPTQPGLNYVGVTAIANVYDDTQSGAAKDFPEIVLIGVKTMACLNLNAATKPPFQPYWWLQTNSDDSGYTGCSVFDFNGDGLQEIVYRDQSDIRIMYGGAAPFPPGVDAERNWWKSPLGSITLDEFPVVADVNNDKQADIVVTGFDKPFVTGQPFTTYDGRIVVYNSAKIPWMPCRTIWNQLNYNHVNILDDLKVPQFQQKHWLEFPGPGGKKWPFNTALSQISRLTDRFVPGFPVPDAKAVLDSFYCENGQLNINFKVCNQGSTTLPDKTPIQFYLGNPTSTAATVYGAPVLLPGKLEKDSCRTLKFSMPLPPNGTLWGIVNDNGSLTPPFKLDKNFPSTAQLECDYVNNAIVLNASFSKPSVDLGPDRVLCSSSVSTLTASGMARYRWQDGSTDSTFTAAGPGKYWVDVWNICGEKATDTLLITVQNTLPLELGPNLQICTGDTVKLSAPGFDKVQWSPIGTTLCPNCPNIGFAPDTTVVLRVSGQTGTCITSDSVRIEVKKFPDLSATILPESCKQKDGAISLNATGGNAGLSFKWENGESTSSLTNLAPGIYRVTVSNATACSLVKSYEILPTTLPVLSDTIISPISCFSVKNGSIAVTPGGGAGSYTYAWSHDPTANSNSQTGLAAGTYTLTLSDAKGCSSTASFELTEPPALVLDAVMDSTDCSSATASISTTVAGGAKPYTYIWSNGEKTPDIVNLKPGTYELVVMDGNGCTKVRSFVVQASDAPSLSDTAYTTITCFSANNGGISVSPTGGSGAYTYAWSNDPTAKNNSQTGLSAGTYTLTISDAKGCSSTAVFELQQPPALQLSTVMDSTNCQRTTANITVSANGGTGTLRFEWDNGNKTPEQKNLPPGTYSVTITDANNCISSNSYTVLPGGSPALMDTAYTAITCFSANNGGISVSPTGGSGAYTYAWSNDPTAKNNSQTGLSAGTYTLTISDAKGCSSTAVFELQQPPALQLSAVMDSTNCQRTTANITVSANGGTGTLRFEWDNGNKTPEQKNLAPGTYSVTITDANNCISSNSYTVLPGGSPALMDTAYTAITCFSANNGGISVSPTGGAGAYTYAWSNDPTAKNNSQTGLSAGTYTLTLSDAKGCSSTAVFELQQPPALQLSAVMDSTNCQRTTANITVSANGGTGTLRFEWDNGNKTPEQKNLPPGTYSVTITDANNCISSNSYTVLPGGSPALMDTAYTAITCFSANNGGISVSPTGGAGAYTYAWSNDPMAKNNSQTGLSAGTYTLTLSDAKGCSSTAVFELQQPPALQLSAVMDSTNCQRTTANITVSANGGTGTLRFEWDNGNKTPEQKNLAPGTYSVTITDANNCISSNSYTVLPGGSPELALTGGLLNCQQQSALLVASPVLGNHIYQWKSPSGTLLSGPQQLVSEAGIYVVTVSDPARGCSTTATVEVKESEDITGLETNIDSVSCFGYKDGAIAILEVIGGTSPYLFSIDNQSFTTNKVIAQLSAGSYTLTVKDAAGCTFAQSVQVHQPPVLSVVLSASDSLVNKGNTVQLVATVSPANRLLADISWLPQSILSNNLEATTNVQSNSLFRILITDENGCTAEDSLRVKVKDGGIYHPNVITPNSRENSGFTLYTDQPGDRIRWLRIYDRWGELIFERLDFPANEPSLGWQGDYKGKRAQSGVFIFSAKVLLENGKEEMVEGDLTVF